MEPPGPAFGRPDDKLSDIRVRLSRMSLRSIRAARLAATTLVAIIRDLAGTDI
jgi:hypothetical protein